MRSWRSISAAPARFRFRQALPPVAFFFFATFGLLCVFTTNGDAVKFHGPRFGTQDVVDQTGRRSTTRCVIYEQLQYLAPARRS
jgi:hypothetical protein